VLHYKGHSVVPYELDYQGSDNLEIHHQMLAVREQP